MTLGREPKGSAASTAETAGLGLGQSPAPCVAVNSRTPSASPAECASRPEQLTIDAFPEWDGTLPVPYNIVPY